MTKFNTIESLNKAPFSKEMLRLFPTLSQFEGLCINLYRGKLYNPENCLKAELHLFPKLLSRNHDSGNHLPIDLLIDNFQFRDTHTKPTSNFKSKHILSITSLPKLCKSCNPLTKYIKNELAYLCRMCLKLFRFQEEFTRHSGICCSFPRGRPFQPRQARNIKTYRPYRWNRFTKTMEPNYLEFKLGDLFKSVKPPASSFIGISPNQQINSILC